MNQIKETRKAVRDSEAGLEKMAIGRHLNDRGHVITRQKDTRTGDMEENQDYLNFDECKHKLFTALVYYTECVLWVFYDMHCSFVRKRRRIYHWLLLW